uniref:Uncharacterized protein n=1 Tax=Nelumbo nucifera TaxID=4432 RepID=A0A822YJD2_NELNU|nr:TPA_asm: hypothetical protein HUJ06_011478 [Nelumbo nucifera]
MNFRVHARDELMQIVRQVMRDTVMEAAQQNQ